MQIRLCKTTVCLCVHLHICINTNIYADKLQKIRTKQALGFANRKYVCKNVCI